MNVKFFRSFKWKISLSFLALMLLIGLGTIGLLSLQLGKHTGRLMDERYSELLDAKAAELERIAEHMEAQTRLLFSSGSFTPDRLPQGLHAADAAVLVSGSGKYGTNGKTILDISDSGYFRDLAHGSSDFAVGDTIVSPFSGKPALVFACKVPGQAGAQPEIGLLLIKLDELERLTQSIQPKTSGVSWVIDASGQIILHPDASVLGKHIDTTIGNKDRVARLPESPPGGSDSRDKNSDTGFYTYTRKISHTAGWTLFMSVPETETKALVRKVNLILASVTCTGLVPVFIIAAVLARLVADPINVIAGHFRSIAAGEADLTKTLPVYRKDELGELVENFNVFLEGLRDMISRLQESQSHFHAILEKIHTDTIQNRDRSLVICEHITSVHHQARTLGHSAVETSAATEEISQNLSSFDRSINAQAGSVTRASEAVQQFMNTISLIFLSVERLAEDASELVVAASASKVQKEAAKQILAEIQEESKALASANATITAIAAQTKILGLNAAIEAVHAGRSGHGFKVVAAQIQKLAEEAAVQSVHIDKNISSVQRNIGSLVRSSADLNNTMALVDRSIHETSGKIQEIRLATAEQQSAATRLLDNIAVMQSLTAEVRDGSKEISAGNGLMVAESVKLKEISLQVDSSLAMMKQEAQAMDESTGSLAETMNVLASYAGQIEDMISRFKV